MSDIVMQTAMSIVRPRGPLPQETPDLTALPASRALAVDLGVSRYFTGTPCRKGHVTYRHVASRACSECMNGNGRRHYLSKSKTFHAEKATIRRRLRTPDRIIEENSSRRVRRRALKTKEPVIQWCAIAIRNANVRAKKAGVPFDISVDYIYSLCVTHCPALGVELVYCNAGNHTDNSASLDRKIPRLGYVNGNIQVISRRANVIKNNSTTSEFAMVYHWLKRLLAKAT